MRTVLGKLIGTPVKDTVTVIYNGRKYKASEEDLRYICALCHDNPNRREEFKVIVNGHPIEICECGYLDESPEEYGSNIFNLNRELSSILLSYKV